MSVLAVNDPAKNSFNIEFISHSLEDYFSSESCELISLEISRMYSTGKSESASRLNLKLISGTSLEVIVRINQIRIYEERVIVFKINQLQTDYDTDKINSLEIQPSDYDALKIPLEIRNVFEKLSSHYPLTFIGKESVRRKIDELKEFFWMQDYEGKILMVNKSFADSFGLKPHQMEGKSFSEFIPGFLENLFSSVDRFLKESSSTLILSGSVLRSFPTLNGSDIILIPVMDLNKNVVALTGYSRKKETKKEVKFPDIFDKNVYTILNKLPYPVALLDSSGYFKHTNKEFCNFFARKFNDLSILQYHEVLTLPLAETISQFINSNSDGIIIEVNQYLEVVPGFGDFKVFIDKIIDLSGQYSGILLNFVKTEFIDDLQQLIKSKGRMFDVLIKKNPEPIFIYDKENLKFLEVNDTALRLYGYTRDEFIQMDLTDLYSPEDIQTLLDTSSSSTPEGVFGPPLRHRRKDGSSILVRLSKIGFMFNDKDAEFNIIRDVSENLVLQQKTHHFQLAFENSSDLIFVTDPTGIITSVNESAIKNLNLSQEEILDTSLATYGFDEDRVVINNTIFLSELKNELSLDVLLKNSEGLPIDIKLSIYPEFDVNGEVEAYTIIGKIKSKESGVSEEQVREVIKEVVVEKGQSNLPADRLQLDPNFLHGIFHEILTPMNVILGFTQELAESIGQPSAEQNEAVDIINQNRTALLGTMNSIIEYTDSYLKNTQIEVEEISVTNLIEHLDNSIREITGKKEIDFAYGKISSSLKFSSDRKKFEVLMHNLIKLVSRTSDINKIYFSAQPYGEDDFVISFSDKYGSISENLLSVFDTLFLHSVDPKELGVSKLTTQIARTLLALLAGEYISFTDSHGRRENGFRFPLNYEEQVYKTPAEEETLEEEIITEESGATEISEEIHEEEFITDEPTSIEIEEEPVQNKVEEIPEPEKFIPDETIPTAEEFEIEMQETQPPVIDQNEKDEFFPENNSIIEGDTFEEIIPEEPIQEPEQILPEEKFDELQDKISEEEFYQSEPVEEQISIGDDQDSQFEKAEKLDLSGLTCLYIEDQVDSQILFKVQMKGLKEIKFCASFEEALPVLESRHFDFIVMDINLQGEYNGLDALKIVHRMPGLELVPIIAVTAYVLPGDREKFIATGFNDFISKPIFREKLVESLQKIFVHK